MAFGRRVPVEDDHAPRAFVLGALVQEGYEVLAARDGAAGLELAREALPAVILLDTQMPVLDGPGFLRAYRQPPGPHAPVVVLAGLPPDAPDGAADDLAAADACLVKRVDLDELLDLVRAHAVGAAE